MTATDLARNTSRCALIDELTCPYCGGGLVAEKGVGDGSDQLEYGILTCGCGDAPVVGGILWLSRRHGSIAPQDDPVLRRVLKRLRDEDYEGALCEALLSSFRDRYRRAATAVERVGGRPPEWLWNQARQRLMREVVQDPGLTFSGALALLRNGPYARYLYHRFANPSLLASIPAILLLRELGEERGPRVLDIGGGCGHASFLVNRFFPEAQVILTDADFVNLYLARRFITPDAVCMCLDAEARMPFAPGSIDAVFCMDAFHYVREKIGLVEELRRTVRSDGMWLFPHLHNARANNPTPGYPLSPRGYARAFAGVPMRMFSEDMILREFHGWGGVDLSFASEDLFAIDAAALTMIGGPESLWRVHNFSELYPRSLADLNLNTVYESESGGVGPLKWPTHELRQECKLAEEFLPLRPSVPPELLAGLRNGDPGNVDQDAAQRFAREFVLVPMPPGYR